MTLSALDYWRLSDELSVLNATILAVGGDPSEMVEVWFDGVPDLVKKRDHIGFDAVFTAIKGAVISNKLAASVAFPVGRGDSSSNRFFAILKHANKLFQNRTLNFYDHGSLVFLQTEPDWDKTMVDVGDIRAFFSERGFYPPFFFPKGDPKSFMNAAHPRYSSKLACAVAAWEAVTHGAKNKSVKQTVLDWVAANGVRFGLTGKDGTVPGGAAEDVAKVVNWVTEGGAPRTGGEVVEGSFPEPRNSPDNYSEVTIMRNEYGLIDDTLPF